MSRQKAREIALHLIFELSFRKEEAVGELLQDRLDSELRASIAGDVELYAGKLTRKQTDYIITVVRGVMEQKEELDALIRANLTGWNLSRLSRITTSLLRLAIYEMQQLEDVPTGVAINEAIELAKKYDSDEAGAFINGVLGAVARGEGKTDLSATAEQLAQETDEETVELVETIADEAAAPMDTAESVVEDAIDSIEETV